MVTACKTRLRTTPTWTRRPLLEWSAATSSGSPLKIDRERGVIEGVKVLGRVSRNSHGLREAVNGTEYTRACMEAALPLYEGCDVLVDHSGPSQKDRSSADVFGQLRNVRLAEDGIRADLHYLKSHELADRVCEDVERGLGVFGLSHDASAARERFDRGTKRLVIESLAAVRSVDLVRKPASNRNLWESEEPTVPTTLRNLLEALKLTPARDVWRRRLLEDNPPSMDASMDAPMDSPADAGSNPEDALWAGFQAAIGKILDQYKSGELDAKAAGKQVMDYLKTHDKLMGSSEPAAPAQADAPVQEDASCNTSKTDANKSEAEKENAKLRHRLAVRELCEAAGVKPDKVLLESLEAVPEATARKLIEREKARGGSPRSSSIQSGGGSGNFKPAADGSEFAKRIKG